MNNPVLNIDIAGLSSELAGTRQATKETPENKDGAPAAGSSKKPPAADKSSIKAINFRILRSDLLLLRDLSSKEEKSIQLLIEEGLREVLKQYGKKPEAFKGVSPKKE